MISPKCDKCGEELDDFGGILFSPPEGKNVQKFHVCKSCYNEIIKNFVSQ